MKTAMKSAIEDIFNARFKIKSENDVVQLCNELMAKYEETEKQQIIDAANQDKFCDLGGVTKGQYYFHDKYND